MKKVLIDVNGCVVKNGEGVEYALPCIAQLMEKHDVKFRTNISDMHTHLSVLSDYLVNAPDTYFVFGDTNFLTSDYYISIDGNINNCDNIHFENAADWIDITARLL